MNPGRLAYIAYFRSALCCAKTKLAEAIKIDNSTNIASTFSLQLSFSKESAYSSPANFSKYDSFIRKSYDRTSESAPPFLQFCVSFLVLSAPHDQANHDNDHSQSGDPRQGGDQEDYQGLQHVAGGLQGNLDGA